MQLGEGPPAFAKLPLDLPLCKLILYGAATGMIADAIVLAVSASIQDPFIKGNNLSNRKDRNDNGDKKQQASLVLLHFDSRKRCHTHICFVRIETYLGPLANPCAQFRSSASRWTELC